jgi:hypothetical protein
MLEELGPDGKPVRQWVKGKLKGEAGPWGNQDVQAYLDYLQKK